MHDLPNAYNFVTPEQAPSIRLDLAKKRKKAAKKKKK
jgi:hypothetical protein